MVDQTQTFTSRKQLDLSYMQRAAVLRRLTFIVAAILLVMGIWYAFGFSLTLNPTQRLSDARQQWTAYGIDNYRIHVVATVPFRTNNLYVVTVEDGDIQEVATINPQTFRYDPNPPTFPVSTMQGEPYTVDALFNTAERLVRTFDWLHVYTPSTSNVRYHPDYGYVEHYTRNTCGVLLTFVPECVTSFEVVRFERLEDGE